MCNENCKLYNQENLVCISERAWDDPLLPENIKTGFQACIPYPFNPKPFHNRHFTPSCTFDTQLITTINQVHLAKSTNVTIVRSSHVISPDQSTNARIPHNRHQFGN